MNIFKKIKIGNQRKIELEYLKKLRPYQNEYFFMTYYWESPLTKEIESVSIVLFVSRTLQYSLGKSARTYANENMMKNMRNGIFRNNMGDDKRTSIWIEKPIWGTCTKISKKDVEIFWDNE